MKDAEDRRDQLGDQCGRGRAGNAEIQYQHKQDIQRYIRKRSHDHGIQRRLAVAQRPQDTGQQIVEHNDRDSSEHDPQIEGRIAHDALRRLQDMQNRRHQQLPRNRQHRHKSH